MTTERTVLAGGCFWGVQELFRRYDGVLSTRVGYTGGSVPNATYRNHGSHAEAVEVIFDPARISYRQILEFFFQIHDPSTRNRQGNDVGPSYRSAIFYTSDEQRRIAEDTIADVDASACGPTRLLLKSFQQATSGRPNPSIRTTSSDIPAATPAISSGQTGGCRFARTRLLRRRERRSSFHPLGETSCEQCAGFSRFDCPRMGTIDVTI
jgi:peptide-methionine (S)-S-oxide reductase